MKTRKTGSFLSSFFSKEDIVSEFLSPEASKLAELATVHFHEYQHFNDKQELIRAVSICEQLIEVACTHSLTDTVLALYKYASTSFHLDDDEIDQRNVFNYLNLADQLSAELIDQEQDLKKQRKLVIGRQKALSLQAMFALRFHQGNMLESTMHLLMSTFSIVPNPPYQLEAYRNLFQVYFNRNDFRLAEVMVTKAMSVMVDADHSIEAKHLSKIKIARSLNCKDVNGVRDVLMNEIYPQFDSILTEAAKSPREKHLLISLNKYFVTIFKLNLVLKTNSEHAIGHINKMIADKLTELKKALEAKIADDIRTLDDLISGTNFYNNHDSLLMKPIQPDLLLQTLDKLNKYMIGEEIVSGIKQDDICHLIATIFKTLQSLEQYSVKNIFISARKQCEAIKVQFDNDENIYFSKPLFADYESAFIRKSDWENINLTSLKPTKGKCI